MCLEKKVEESGNSLRLSRKDSTFKRGLLRYVSCIFARMNTLNVNTAKVNLVIACANPHQFSCPHKTACIFSLYLYFS